MNSQLPRKRPLLQRREQGVQLGQGGAVGGFEGFDGLDAGSEGLLEGEWGSWNSYLSDHRKIQILLTNPTLQTAEIFASNLDCEVDVHG